MLTAVRDRSIAAKWPDLLLRLQPRCQPGRRPSALTFSRAAAFHPTSGDRPPRCGSCATVSLGSATLALSAFYSGDGNSRGFVFTCGSEGSTYGPCKLSKGGRTAETRTTHAN
jgi:hypothetical protein